MLFGENVNCSLENNMKRMNTLWEQNAEIQYVKAGGSYTATDL
jgi:hypothetical protein